MQKITKDDAWAREHLKFLKSINVDDYIDEWCTNCEDQLKVNKNTKCRYCYKSCCLKCIAIHESYCSKNPKKIEQEEHATPCFFCGKYLDVVYKLKRICIDGSIWFQNMLWPQVRDNYLLVDDLECTPTPVCKKCEHKITVTYHRPNPDKWDELEVLNVLNRDSEYQDGDL